MYINIYICKNEKTIFGKDICEATDAQFVLGPHQCSTEEDIMEKKKQTVLVTNSTCMLFALYDKMNKTFLP